MQALSDSGPTVAEVEKVKEAQLRSRETESRTNAFWINRLSSAYQYGDDPRDILTYQKEVDGLTATAIRNAARRYLKGDGFIHVTLLPETITP